MPENLDQVRAHLWSVAKELESNSREIAEFSLSDEDTRLIDTMLKKIRGEVDTVMAAVKLR